MLVASRPCGVCPLSCRHSLAFAVAGLQLLLRHAAALQGILQPSGEVLFRELERAVPDAQRSGTDIAARLPSPLAAIERECMPSLFGLSAAAGGSNARFECSPEEEGGCHLLMPNIQACALQAPEAQAQLAGRHRGEPAPPWIVTWVSVAREPLRSRFTWGALPEIVPLEQRKELRLAKPPSAGEGNSWFKFISNPSFIELPARWKQEYPAGRWLAVYKTGRSVYTHHDEYEEPQSWAVILDAEFESLDAAPIRVQGRDAQKEGDFSIVWDARITGLSSGDVLLSFIAYSEDMETEQAVAKLYLDNALGLQAWIQLSETRKLKECPEQGLHAPSPHKNLGFFEHSPGNISVLDWIHPTKVGELNFTGLTDGREATHESGIAHLCFGHRSSFPPLEFPPWAGAVSQECPHLGPHGLEGAQGVEIHNSCDPLWIEETQEYLGIGHYRRGFASWDGYFECNTSDPTNTAVLHHYTSIFYTMTGRESPKLSRMGSSEFCGASPSEPSDCDAIQFVSTMVRDGDQLHVGMGVMDRRAAVMTLSLAKVLASLKPVN